MAQSSSIPPTSVPVLSGEALSNPWRQWAQRLQSVNFPTTVAGLPLSARTPINTRYVVTDATSTTFLADPVGGGAHEVPVVNLSSGWRIG